MDFGLLILDWKSETGAVTMNEAELKGPDEAVRVPLHEAGGQFAELGFLGRAIGGQLARCGTSVGANYRSACRGRSKAEFIAKLGVVEEEADESGFWIEFIIESGLKSEQVVEPLHLEADELVRILASSIKTARFNPKSEVQNSKIENLTSPAR